MAGGCCKSGKPTKITVKLPSGEVREASSRPAALAIVTRYGGVIRGA